MVDTLVLRTFVGVDFDFICIIYNCIWMLISGRSQWKWREVFLWKYLNFPSARQKNTTYTQLVHNIQHTFCVAIAIAIDVGRAIGYGDYLMCFLFVCASHCEQICSRDRACPRSIPHNQRFLMRFDSLDTAYKIFHGIERKRKREKERGREGE